MFPAKFLAEKPKPAEARKNESTEMVLFAAWRDEKDSGEEAGEKEGIERREKERERKEKNKNAPRRERYIRARAYAEKRERYKARRRGAVSQ